MKNPAASSGGIKASLRRFSRTSPRKCFNRGSRSGLACGELVEPPLKHAGMTDLGLLICLMQQDAGMKLGASKRRQHFFTQQFDLLIPIVIAEAKVENDEIGAGHLIRPRLLDNILRTSGENQSANILQR